VELRAFYHAWAGGSWTLPLTEHVAAVREARLDCPVTAGITGQPGDVAQVTRWLARNWPEADPAPGTGAEQHTLALAWRWAREHPDAAVLYCHTKGAADPTWFNHCWRESMTLDVVGRWPEALAALDDGYDAAGPHWLDPEIFPNMAIATAENGGAVTPYFGGNFWMARADYLAGLPEPDPGGTRHDAERWIGLGLPKARDLRSGWPSPMLFAGRTIRFVLSGGRPL
jgi:hypothetical protein